MWAVASPTASRLGDIRRFLSTPPTQTSTAIEDRLQRSPSCPDYPLQQELHSSMSLFQPPTSQTALPARRLRRGSLPQAWVSGLGCERVLARLEPDVDPREGQILAQAAAQEPNPRGRRARAGSARVNASGVPGAPRPKRMVFGFHLARCPVLVRTRDSAFELTKKRNLEWRVAAGGHVSALAHALAPHVVPLRDRSIGPGAEAPRQGGDHHRRSDEV